MGLFDSMNVNATGLTAERLRMDVISKNIANANTTKTENGMPYRRQVVSLRPAEEKSFKEVLGSKITETKGVEVESIKEDQSPFNRIYSPGHPDADKDGYVLMANVNVVSEMVDMISATRAYEANLNIMNMTKNMMLKSLDIGK